MRVLALLLPVRQRLCCSDRALACIRPSVQSPVLRCDTSLRRVCQTLSSCAPGDAARFHDCWPTSHATPIEIAPPSTSSAAMVIVHLATRSTILAHCDRSPFHRQKTAPAHQIGHGTNCRLCERAIHWLPLLTNIRTPGRACLAGGRGGRSGTGGIARALGGDGDTPSEAFDKRGPMPRRRAWH